MYADWNFVVMKVWSRWNLEKKRRRGEKLMIRSQVASVWLKIVLECLYQIFRVILSKMRILM